MSKKVKEPSTPETRAAKLANRQMLRKVFTSTFFKAFSVCLAILLVVSTLYIAFVRPARTEMVEPEAGQPVANAVTPSAGGAAPSAGDAAATGAPTADVTEITASSTDEEKLAYFNTVMNKVKPGAKKISITKEYNSQEGSIQGDIPGSLVSIANTLIKSNMGESKKKLPPASTEAEKNAMFPVENESWCSKLTMDDVQSISVEEAGDKYTIAVVVKDDELSKDTAHGVGHTGKAISVITPDVIMENAGPAKGMLKNVQTCHKNNKITITVDKATGNVLEAKYFFVWTLSLEALGVQIVIPFGLDKQFAIEW